MFTITPVTLLLALGLAASSAAASASTSASSDTNLCYITEPAVPVETSTAPDTAASRSACRRVDSVVVSCSSKLPGFSTIENTQLASCLCYDNGKYATTLDDDIATCLHFVETNAPDNYKSVSAFLGYCQRYPPGDSSVTESPSPSTLVTASFANTTSTGTTASTGTAMGTKSWLSTPTATATASVLVTNAASSPTTLALPVFVSCLVSALSLLYVL